MFQDASAGNIYIQCLKRYIEFVSLVPEGVPPELCSVGLGDAEVVTLKQTIGEDGLQLRQHVAEDQRQLGEVPPEEVKSKGESVRVSAFIFAMWPQCHQPVQQFKETNAEQHKTFL